MLYIGWILQNKEIFVDSMNKRGRDGASDFELLVSVDADRRSLIQITEELQKDRNVIAKEIGAVKSKGGDSELLMAKSNEIKEKLSTLEDQTKQKQAELEEILARIPNVLDADVPFGKTDDDNLEIKRIGNPKVFDFTPKEHFELGEKLGDVEMDFETATKISGSRFVILKNNLAKLERALINLMLEHNSSRGFIEVSPPLLTKSGAFFGTGQLPKFEGNFFEVHGGYYLIPTAEVSLTNMVASDIIDEFKLPLRFTAATPCFRSEAGSAGKDTKGMIRQHQFYKVEMVSICHPEGSKSEHEYMLETAEKILQMLDLPYRVVVLCSGDIGGTAVKTYDLEVWLPGQGRYREISSISNTRDYQARRMMARYRKASDKKTEYLHTLNGSALAVGRTIVAILENYQNSDGSINVPDALVPLMGGTTVLR